MSGWKNIFLFITISTVVDIWNDFMPNRRIVRQSFHVVCTFVIDNAFLREVRVKVFYTQYAFTVQLDAPSSTSKQKNNFVLHVTSVALF